MRAAALAWLGLLFAAAASAQSTPWQVEGGVGGDRLSGGRESWSQVDFALRHRWAARSVAEISLRQTRRSGQDDSEVAALGALPLDANWNASVAASLSPTHRALAREGMRLELARALADGWVAQMGLTRRLYRSGGVADGNRQLTLGMERYAGPWRWAVAVGQTHLDSGGGAGSLRMQLDRSFADERGRIGIIAATGREVEGVAATASAPADLIDQRVNSVALVGTWPLAPAWALTGELATVHYSDAQTQSATPTGAPYRRNGLRIGVRHDF